MAGEIKSRKWMKFFLYYHGMAYASAVMGISLLLSSSPKPQSALQSISLDGLALWAIAASVFLIWIGKMIANTDAHTWKLEGDLRFQLAQESLNLRRLKEAW
jgi:ABC-type uncharacterized transport system fused permease/ATPase subunit